ncbi:carbohydrate binding family 9 domain-containing protein [Undibacterium crateris]|uniref:carbohydrate binding family 9 domain-containing protein n=1 Tax=Undibacterium crateris TaxID=2528175 RepID=UPI00138A5B21|nr:carbohydrate binding family 9 domain-containing protein [Undibacterium crateris]NDI86014.1 hypothetical protein [Undibacterium crateris]
MPTPSLSKRLSLQGCSLALSMLCSAVYAAPTGFQAYPITDKTQRIQVDGKLDDEIWSKAAVFDTFYQTQPVDQQKAHLKTEVRLAYDEKYLYVGIKAYDDKAALIRAPFARRDKISIDQDFVALYIDASGSHKSSQVFYVNARGAIMDGMYADMTGDDTAPDYDYQVATALQDDGWSAEYRIPFSEIAYDKNAEKPWSLLVLRNMTRDQRYRMYSGGVTRAASCNLCFSDDIQGLKNLPSGMNWSITPQIVSRRSRDEQSGSPAKSASSNQLSLDMKFRPDSATTFDATIRPDFSQIELDAPQLSGNTRFSIFVSEKRPFFLEGADMLKTPMNVISTRSISNPDAGLRYTRRDGERDISILTARDVAGGLVLLPNSYYTGLATRTEDSIATDARANFHFGSLSAGAVFTDRTLSQSKAYNRVFGPDFIWQRNENEMLRGQLLVSQTTAQTNADGNLVAGASTRGHAAHLEWSRGSSSWAMSATYKDLSKDFRADNGFFSQTGFHSFNSELVKKFGRNGIFHEVNPYLQLEYKRDSLGNIMGRSLIPGIRVASHYDSSAYLAFSPASQSRVSETGEVFSSNKLLAGFGVSPGRQVARVSADLTLGDVIDIDSNRLGRGGTLSSSAKLRLHDRFELEPNFAINWIDQTATPGITQSGRAYSETAFQLNSVLHFSSQDNLRLIYQRGHVWRNPTLYQKAVAADSERHISSLVYTHTESLGRVAYLGWTRSGNETPGFTAKRQQNEVFVKLSWRI